MVRSLKKIKKLLTSNSQALPGKKKKKKKKLNFLNKFKVKLSKTEHAALCLPYFKAWLQVSDFLSCSQLCLSKWIPGETRAWLPSAHSSAVS